MSAACLATTPQVLPTLCCSGAQILRLLAEQRIGDEFTDVQRRCATQEFAMTTTDVADWYVGQIFIRNVDANLVVRGDQECDPAA